MIKSLIFRVILWFSRFPWAQLKVADKLQKKGGDAGRPDDGWCADVYPRSKMIACYDEFFKVPHFLL